mmetsp:Transcript_51049/g.94411  ORF Transcript_51049/g.94411 Transcript_51049/m.94411 type:complete len:255 (-) Transcript_51049:70-834(-)
MAEPSEGKADEKAAKPVEAEKKRERIGEVRRPGIVTEWKGHMGWIFPLQPIAHKAASQHRGLVYLSKDDVVLDGTPPARVKVGRVVDFLAYADAEGIGAEECRPLHVLRLTLPHKGVKKKMSEKPLWSANVPNSEYYPEWSSQHKVVLRKYTWQLPFAVMELWGTIDDLAIAAAELCVAEEGSEGSGECDLRLLLPEAEVPKAESFPGSAKVSTHIVLSTPISCHALMMSGSKAECQELVKAYLGVMSVTSLRW